LPVQCNASACNASNPALIAIPTAGCQLRDSGLEAMRDDNALMQRVNAITLMQRVNAIKMRGAST
jgi:hypothetical protein